MSHVISSSCEVEIRYKAFAPDKWQARWKDFENEAEAAEFIKGLRKGAYAGKYMADKVDYRIVRVERSRAICQWEGVTR